MMVCHPTLGPGTDGSGHGGGIGARHTHHRTLEAGLRRGRARGPYIRADRRFPPALDQARREELNAAAQLPRSSLGMEMANWQLAPEAA